MGIEGPEWVGRAWDWCRGLRGDVNGQGRLWMAKDGYRGPEMGVKVFGRVWRALCHPLPSKAVLGPPPHPFQPIHTHLRPSIPIKTINTHLRPSTPI